jgi:protein phosphatase
VHEVFFTTTPRGDTGIDLRHALERANRVIYQRGLDEPQLAGMGTTCTAAVMRGDALTIAHVGDSRAYLVLGGDIRQITSDHSLAAELERRCEPGQQIPEAGRHVLTRCLGVSPDVQVDVNGPIAVEDGNTLVLCSDGLSGPVGGAEIQAAVASGEPEAACRTLVDLARERGGPDNITVQVARVVAARGNGHRTGEDDRFSTAEVRREKRDGA